MSGAEIVLGIIAAFFIIGIVVGVIAVIALSAVRGRRAPEDQRRRGGPDRAGQPGWEEPPGPDDDSDPPSRWPGGYR